MTTLLTALALGSIVVGGGTLGFGATMALLVWALQRSLQEIDHPECPKSEVTRMKSGRASQPHSVPSFFHVKHGSTS
jgi:hypothetical protein